jgi:glycosyltransferase involved in cell wall biosynthesis
VLFFWSSLLWVLFRGRRGDLVFIVSNPPFIGLLGPLLRRLRRLNYVFLFQDLFPRTAVISGVLPAAGPITASWQWLMGTICRQSAATIVLSDTMRKRLLRDCGQPLPLRVIHNWAVEQAKPTPRGQNPFAAEHGFQDRFTLQYSGNYGRLHDLLTLLEAARILKPHPVQLVFIGGGVKQSQIDVYREAFALQNVLRLPYQPRTTLADSLGACDLAAIGLVPGGEDTMAPCKFYGILASGRGVVLVARRTCDLAQIVLNEDIGVVVEPGESEALAHELLQLSKDPDRVQTMGDKARSLYSDRFGRERSVTSYAHLLEQLR